MLLELQARNIVGLNISSSNVVLLEGGRVVVKNFGRAQEFRGEEQERVVQGDGFEMGEYAPPEIKEGRVYRNSDLYSLGVIMRGLFGG